MLGVRHDRWPPREKSRLDDGMPRRRVPSLSLDEFLSRPHPIGAGDPNLVAGPGHDAGGHAFDDGVHLRKGNHVDAVAEVGPNDDLTSRTSLPFPASTIKRFGWELTAPLAFGGGSRAKVPVHELGVLVEAIWDHMTRLDHEEAGQLEFCL